MPRQPVRCPGQQFNPADSRPVVRVEAEEVQLRISRRHSAAGVQSEGAGPSVHIGDANIQRKGGVDLPHKIAQQADLDR